DLDTVAKDKQQLITRNEIPHAVRRGEITLTFMATRPRRTPPSQPFPIYGLTVPEKWSIGAYRCPGERPGCRGAATDVVYYVYSKYNTGNSRIDALFSITPRRNPSEQRWLVAARPGVVSDALQIVSVALDEKRCFVLLEPKPWLAANRVNGRLRL